MNMTTDTDHSDSTACPRSTISKARFQRKPWTQKLALALSRTAVRSIPLLSDRVVVVDETSWPACLFILNHLMERIIELEKTEDSTTTTSRASPLMRRFDSDGDDFRLHHYFDIICGAGVGGLAATLLGHSRLTLEETVTRMTEILSFPRPGILRHFLPSARADNSRQIHIKLHDTMEPEDLRLPLQSCNSPRDVCESNASRLMSVPGMCQTLVLGAPKIGPSKLHVFRSYQQPRNASGNTEAIPDPIALVNACRVSMANPKFYEHVNAPLIIGEPAECMVETTAKSTQLLPLIEQEMNSLHGNTSSLQCLLEISAQSELLPSSWSIPWPFNQRQSSKRQAEAECIATSDPLEHFQIGDISILASYIRRGLNKEAEKHFLTLGLSAQMENCAKVLVQARRSRADTMNWEIFAFANRYKCSICQEQGQDSGILDKPTFFDHVDVVHNFYDLPAECGFKIQTESLTRL